MAAVPGFRQILAKLAAIIGVSRRTGSVDPAPVDSPLEAAAETPAGGSAEACGEIGAPKATAEIPTPTDPPADMPRQLTAYLVTLLIGLSALMVMWHLQQSSLDNANTGSRFATIESLVDHGSYYIDKSQYRGTIDKVKVGKHSLSSKPPTLPTYAAGVYWVYQKITGRTIVSHEGQVVWCVSLFTGWLAHVVFLIYLYRFCQLLLKRQLAIILTVAVGGFAFLGAAYATTINNHSIAASLGLVGFYYAFRIRHGIDAAWWHWIICGLTLGILPSIDLPSLALTAGVGLYLLTHDWRKTLLLFVPCLLPGLIAQLGLSYLTTGSFKPAYGNSEVKFSGSYFRQVKTGIDALYERKHIYAFNALLGHHGLFSMTPVFFFSIWEMGRSFRRRQRLVPELLLATTVCLVVIVFYIWRTHNYGGWCVGMRWFVPIMPLLVLYFGLWLDRVKLTRTLWSVVLAAFLVSAFHVQDGLTSPFQFSVWHNWLEGKPNRSRVGDKMNLRKGKVKKTKGVVEETE